MIRVILYEYRMRFSWKKVGEILVSNDEFPNLFQLTLLPVWFVTLSGTRRMFLFLLIVLALAVNVIMTRMYGNHLPKMMYLIPMEREERKEYLKLSGRLCLGIPAVLYLAACVVVGVYGGVNALGMAAIIISGLAFLLGNHMYLEGDYRDREIAEKIPLLKNYYGWMVGEKVYAVAILACGYLYGSTTNVITAPAVIVIALLLCGTVGLLAGLWRYFSQIRELALDYETAEQYEDSHEKKCKVRK